MKNKASNLPLKEQLIDAIEDGYSVIGSDEYSNGESHLPDGIFIGANGQLWGDGLNPFFDYD